mmetsp:Transcript_7435/g.23373  ORF Transcript_7435/g.23373 Transcript_7435/m.23373 type:complete len:245 (+) Transcript_7435:233-967(+)
MLRASKPGAFARGTVQREQRVAVAWDTVAKPEALGAEEPARPDRFACFAGKLQVAGLLVDFGHLQEQRHEARGAMAPLHALVPSAALRGWQVAALKAPREQHLSSGTHKRRGFTISLRQLHRHLQQRQEYTCDAVRPTEVTLAMPLIVERPRSTSLRPPCSQDLPDDACGGLCKEVGSSQFLPHEQDCAQEPTTSVQDLALARLQTRGTRCECLEALHARGSLARLVALPMRPGLQGKAAGGAL